jgi:hypothetical protein
MGSHTTRAASLIDLARGVPYVCLFLELPKEWGYEPTLSASIPVDQAIPLQERYERRKEPRAQKIPSPYSIQEIEPSPSP